MDALYFYRHSRYRDAEILFSLRSLAENAPWIGKVWILGDRPWFLTDDLTVAEHVPHSYVARTANFRTPITNFFLMFWLSSLLPNLSREYLWLCDDFVVLGHLSESEAKKDRYLENLDDVTCRGTGLWKDSLWRTYDLLKRLGFPRYNFETHTPTFFTKARVFEAYCAFKDYVTEDRWYGMLGPTAILNHAHGSGPGLDLCCVKQSGQRVSFHGHRPAPDTISHDCEGKLFLNFDDDAFGRQLFEFLQARFPRTSKFERPCEPTSPQSLNDLFVSISTVDLPVGRHLE
jgi:hypothetical protein